MTKTISKQVIIDAYNNGLIPSALYSPDANNGPKMSPKLSDLGLPGISSGTIRESITYNRNSQPIKLLIKHFDNFKNVFNLDGTLNPHSGISERYAISLAMDEKYDASIAMFDAITACTKTIDTIVRNNNIVLPVVNRVGLLGFEGIFQYANACYEIGSKDDSDKSKALLEKSKNLYQFIADLYTGYHGGPRFCEVKKESLNMLVNVFKIDRYQNMLLLAPLITN